MQNYTQADTMSEEEIWRALSHFTSLHQRQTQSLNPIQNSKEEVASRNIRRRVSYKSSTPSPRHYSLNWSLRTPSIKLLSVLLFDSLDGSSEFGMMQLRL